MNTKLTLIVSKPGCFASTDFTKYNNLIKKAIHDDHKVSILAGAYLHGKAEYDNHYDIAACLNAESCIDFDNEIYIKGIYPVEIIDYNEECTAYLWNENKKPKGYIVHNSDLEAVSYVKNLYNQQ